MGFLIIHSDKAKEWVEQNIQFEGWQLQGNTISIDHHYLPDIIEGMIQDSLVPETDFSVN